MYVKLGGYRATRKLSRHVSGRLDRKFGTARGGAYRGAFQVCAFARNGSVNLERSAEHTTATVANL